MPFNLKHFFVIGLGVGFAAYCMHNSPSNPPVAFDAPNGEFKPLASLEKLDAPSTADLIEIDTSVLVELSGDFLDATSQVAFETAAEASADNDFVAPESLDTSESSWDLSPTMTENQFEVPVSESTLQPTDTAETEPTKSGEAQIGADENAFIPVKSGESAADTVQEMVAQSVPEIQRHYQQPNSRWKANPFQGQAQLETAPSINDMSSAETTESNDFPIIEVSTINETTGDSMPNDFESEFNKESSILIEAASKKPVDDDTLESFTDTEMPSIQSPATSVQEIPNLVEERIAPLQIALSDGAARRATSRIEYGKSLARKGAAFAGRQEFFSALRIIAQSNDVATGSNDFSVALSQAIMAMNEAKDFVNRDAEFEAVIDVGMIIETHRSNVLNQTQAKSMPPNQAIKKYLSFARQKLDQAGGRNVVAAEALYCLGKLHSGIAEKHVSLSSMDTAKAIVFHQAALLSDKNNFRSANELGVLMTRTGQLEKATSLFKQSLLVQPTPNTWRNLAITHRRLGQEELAQLAEVEFSIAARRPVNSSTAGIRWMPTADFNAEAPMPYDARIASNPAPPADTAMNQNTQAEKKKKKSLAERLKDLF